MPSPKNNPVVGLPYFFGITDDGRVKTQEGDLSAKLLGTASFPVAWAGEGNHVSALAKVFAKISVPRWPSEFQLGGRCSNILCKHGTHSSYRKKAGAWHVFGEKKKKGKSERLGIRFKREGGTNSWSDDLWGVHRGEEEKHLMVKRCFSLVFGARGKGNGEKRRCERLRSSFCGNIIKKTFHFS